MKTLSKYLNFEDCYISDTAVRLRIDNQPSDSLLETLKHTANLYDKIVEGFGMVRINSFYRSFELNKAIGGSQNSQHCKGEAMDLSAIPPKTNIQLFHYIRQNLQFDQLIWEGDDAKGEPRWVHVSIKKSGNRQQVLRMRKDNSGKNVYELWK